MGYFQLNDHLGTLLHLFKLSPQKVCLDNLVYVQTDPQHFSDMKVKVEKKNKYLTEKKMKEERRKAEREAREKLKQETDSCDEDYYDEEEEFDEFDEEAKGIDSSILTAVDPIEELKKFWQRFDEKKISIFEESITGLRIIFCFEFIEDYQLLYLRYLFRRTHKVETVQLTFKDLMSDNDMKKIIDEVVKIPDLSTLSLQIMHYEDELYSQNNVRNVLLYLQ